MTEWSPKQYLLFADQRTQPAADLAARVAGRAGRAGGTGKTVRTAVDVGCGPGNSTAVLRHTFPEARLLGVDLSPEMVERAARQYPEIAFRVGDAASLTGQYDLIFSNACLQWVPQHETLIPGLMERLTSGGVLAVQMPMNDDEPFYRIIREVTEDAKWGFRGVELETNATCTPAEYFDLLSGCASSFDMWECKYYHRLPDHRALIEWVRGTRLRPYLARLDEDGRAALEDELLARAAEAYPLTRSGEVLFGFRRFFFTATR